MKTNASIARATDPAQQTQRITAQEKAADKSRVDSITFSPEGITNRAFTTTTVLTEILEREEKTYHSRHWGINE
jgi:hypothetical protein